MHINMCTIQPSVPKVYLRRLPRPTHDASLRGQLSCTFGVSSHHGAPASVGGFSCARRNGGVATDRSDRQVGLLHKNGHIASGKPSNSPGPRTRAVAIPGLEEKNLRERSEEKNT